MAAAAKNGGPPWIRVRREPFEYGLLPLPSLLHSEGVAPFHAMKDQLLAAASTAATAAGASLGGRSTAGKRVSTAGIASCLNLSDTQAHLVLDTLASVLPDDGPEADPLALAAVPEIPAVGADIDHLILFLYIQIYRRVAHRPLPNSPALADIWPPAPSPFDNYPPATSSSVIQVKTTAAGRPRPMPGQGEEEAHELAFIQKHLPQLLSLLADPLPEGEDEAARAISGERLECLGLLLRAGLPGRETEPLRQVTPFFANSDPTMPAAPAPVTQVQDWLLRHVCGASEHVRGPPGSPSGGSSSGGGGDVSMGEAGPGGGGGEWGDVTMGEPSSSTNGSASSSVVPGVAANGSGQARDFWPAGMTCIDGVTKMSTLKGESDIEAGVVRASHCHDSVVYVLAPLKCATVVGCSDSIVVLGPVGKAVKVENCERVTVIAPCARIRISNCRECVFYLGTNQSPLVTGDNHNLQVAPYNTFYPKLEAHLTQAGVDPTINRWETPLSLAAADPHDPMAHPAGSSEAPVQGAALLPADKFVPFVIPFRGGAENQQQTRGNPFPLPKLYLSALQHKTKTVENLRQTLKTAVLEDSKKKELTNVIQAHFKEWLLASGNIRQVYDLARLDRDP